MNNKKNTEIRAHSASKVVHLHASSIESATEVSSPQLVEKYSLVLQTVVNVEATTPEGAIIEAVTIPWYEIVRLIESDPRSIAQIDHRKWEEIIAGAYKASGFDKVILTPRSGDLGRDVVAIKRGLGTVRVIDQVKAYKPGHLVTADDVRALYGVLEAEKASKGFLTTTSDFAPKLSSDALLKPLIPGRLELINGRRLIERLTEIANAQD